MLKYEGIVHYSIFSGIDERPILVISCVLKYFRKLPLAVQVSCLSPSHGNFSMGGKKETSSETDTKDQFFRLEPLTISKDQLAHNWVLTFSRVTIEMVFQCAQTVGMF